MMQLFCGKCLGLLLALFSFWSLPGVADQSGENLAAYLPSGCYHAGQYRQEKTLAGLAQPLLTTGNFIYACDKGLIWHTATPIVETIIYKTDGKHFTLAADDQLDPLAGRVHQALGTLLNHLIGGDSTYLTRHFRAEQNAQVLRLIPKQKRLRNFIQHIEITPQEEEVEITLQHNANETTRITIFERQVFESFAGESCKTLMPERTMACGALLL